MWTLDSVKCCWKYLVERINFEFSMIYLQTLETFFNFTISPEASPKVINLAKKFDVQVDIIILFNTFFVCECRIWIKRNLHDLWYSNIQNLRHFTTRIRNQVCVADAACTPTCMSRFWKPAACAWAKRLYILRYHYSNFKGRLSNVVLISLWHRWRTAIFWDFSWIFSLNGFQQWLDDYRRRKFRFR